jgi:hypothetical protein
MLRGGVAATLLSLVMLACSIGETTYATVKLPFRAKRETRKCEPPFAKPDLSTLKPCGEGKGHCFNAAKVPLPASQLQACDGGEVCIPDPILKAGGTKLKACTFFMQNKPGACVSTLLKDMKANEKVLQPDVCDEGERCAPCINPMDGVDTHVCDETGAYEKDCVGGTDDSNAEICCHGMGLCSKLDAIPEDNRSNMERNVCPENKVCAPAALIEGAPVKCDVMGMSGVCLDRCFASMLASVGQHMRGGCGPTELCLPCALGGKMMPGCE